MTNIYDSLFGKNTTSALAGMSVGFLNDMVTDLKTAYDHRHTEIQEELSALRREDFSDDFSFFSYRAMLNDLPVEWAEVAILSDELSIVGLYRVIELQTRRILKPHCSNKELKVLHKWNVFKDIVQAKFDIALESFPEYGEIDELRLLNNSIKHSGYVSKSLAKYDGWIEGEKIDSLDQTFRRLHSAVEPYLVMLDEKIEEATSSNEG